MSGRQMGERLGIGSSGVLEMERNEAEGAITLRSLERAAEGLGCTLVYALVPKEGLDAHLRAEAERLARGRVASVNVTMDLEAQGLDDLAREDRIRDETEDLIRAPHQVWDGATGPA